MRNNPPFAADDGTTALAAAARYANQNLVGEIFHTNNVDQGEV